MKMHSYWDIFPRTILRRTSREAHVYIQRHEGAKCDQCDISNIIYHKLSHEAASYKLNGENANNFLESRAAHIYSYLNGSDSQLLSSFQVTSHIIQEHNLLWRNSQLFKTEFIDLWVRLPVADFA